MFTLLGIRDITDAIKNAFNLKDNFRWLMIKLDSVAFSVLEKAYDLFAALANETLINADIVDQIRRNMYVIVGIFAFFRIAMLLINIVISPDALAKQGAGLSKIAVNTVIMIVLLVFTPTIFSWSRTLSNEIVNGSYIQQVFNGAEGSGDEETNPGSIMERIAVSGSILPYEKYVKNGNLNELEVSDACTGNCPKAIACLKEIKENKRTGCVNSKGNVNWDELSNQVKAKTGNADDPDNDDYVYDYNGFILILVGWGMAYVLLVFSFDVAKRMVELAILEITAPLFIATIVDPKSMSGGPFSKWLKATGTSYASLFIRQACIAIMLLFAQLLSKWEPASENLGAFGKLIVLIGILIFINGAPQWFGNLIGMDASGMGGLSLKKKLASAALIGGAVSSGMDKATGFAKQKGKNFLANRARNTAARVGGAKEAISENRALKKRLKKDPSGYDKEQYKNGRQSIFKQSRAAAKQSRSDNWGKDSQGLIKDIGSGYMGGRLNVNSDAISLGKSIQDKQADKARAYNQQLGNTSRNIERADIAKKLKNASDMRNGKIPPGERDKKVHWQGYEEFKTAIGDKAMSEKEAYTLDLKNVAEKSGWRFDDATGVAYNGSKKITWEDHKNTFSDAGQKDVAAYVAKNFQNASDTLKSNVDLKLSNEQKIASYEAQISSLPKGSTAEGPLRDQIKQLQAQNKMINNSNTALVSDISSYEKSFENEPQKCPSAIKVSDDTYVTAIGTYKMDSATGKFVYSQKTGATDVTKVGFDPTTITAVMNKIATIADKKDSDAKDAHSAMQPKES